MKTKILCFWSLLVVSFASAAEVKPANPPATAKEIKIGLVFDKGGKDDKSFNASALEGAMRAKKKFNSFLKYVEATDDNSFEPLLRSLAQKNFDLILAIGFSQIDAVKKISAQFPQIKFGLVDGEVQAPNVRSMMFEEHEGSFLVGAIAGFTTKTGKVGFIGGMDIPLIRRFALGFEEGVRRANPKVKIVANYVGVTADAWNNPAKAKELAVSQYNTGADVIFSASGASGTGIFDAAEEKRKLAIGVDSNQNWIRPGFILTSMVKRVDEAVFMTIQDVVSGAFTGGTVRYGLSNKGVDYTVDQYNEKLLTPEVRRKAEEFKAQIIAGQIKVSDFYKVKK